MVDVAKRFALSVLALVLAFQLTGMGVAVQTAYAVAATSSDSSVGITPRTDKDSLVVVSLGDSYSAGEGVEDYYGKDLRADSTDWLAHRSTHSWPGSLVFDVGGESVQLRDHRAGVGKTEKVKWYFAASSGAVTADITDAPQSVLVSPGRTAAEALLSKKEYRDLGCPQIDVLKSAALANGGSVDYVTLTIGGNDLGFVAAVTSCVSAPGNYDGLYDQLQAAYDKFNTTTRDDLLNTYREVSEAAGKGARIIVAGYPQLLTEYTYSSYGVSTQQFESFLFESGEVEALNDAVSWFNNQLENLVAQVNSERTSADDPSFYFVSVEENFAGHGALSEDEYVEGAVWFWCDQDLQQPSLVCSNSFHPNFCGTDRKDNSRVDCGIHAYSNAVQAVIDKLEQADAQATSVAPVTSIVNEDRDVVLVLDVSSSMSGNIDELKTAVQTFCDQSDDGNNRVSLVTFSSKANTLCGLTTAKDDIRKAAEGLKAESNTNMDAGLQQAQAMLKTSSAKKKIIILLSDGEANAGRTGDELVAYADELKSQGIDIFTLGFFGKAGSGKSAEQQVMEDIASDSGFHYEVTNAESLVYIFGDIADQINGVRFMYLRIECPVEVEVTSGGEVLSSASSKESQRTSFGTLTFQEVDQGNNTGSSSGSSADLAKILRLREGQAYEVAIKGTGDGSMTCVAGFVDEDGNYSDYRTFDSLPVASTMNAKTTMERGDYTLLQVDSDGDGSYEKTYRADSNSVGYEVDSTPTIYATLGFCLSFTVAGIAVALLVALRRR